MTRRASWLIGALAYTLPIAWAYFENERVYGTAAQEGRFLICGLFVGLLLGPWL